MYVHTLWEWFCNVRRLLENGIEGPQNARSLKLNWEFLFYKPNILSLKEVRYWRSGEYSLSCGTALLYSWKPNGIRRETGDEVLLTVTARHIWATWELDFDSIFTARFRSRFTRILSMSNRTQSRRSPLNMWSRGCLSDRNDNVEGFVNFCSRLIFGGLLFEQRTWRKVNEVWQRTSNLIDNSCLLNVRNQKVPASAITWWSLIFADFRLCLLPGRQGASSSNSIVASVEIL